MQKKMIVEVCVYSIESAIAAQEGGADRIELCDNIYDGGTTPSVGTMEIARKHLSIDFYAIIRPRGGDFLYTDAEFEVMKKDVLSAKRLGLDGVVFGILTKDGKIDKERCRELVDLAGPLGKTFHRAFDLTQDPKKALEDIIDLGMDRILTSGQKALAIDGACLIKELNEVAANRIKIMAGSGVSSENIEELSAQTGVNEFHMSARSPRRSNMEYQRRGIPIGHPSLDEYVIEMADPEKVLSAKRMTEALIR
ncbi:copper homeostasis protein CutC [Fulvivirgaceae bacterium BMA10]|uniref:PF03932 family protein CutC n=1 Tax=Splendidivirga corallicola TaxID=3051826 RepID=A0ABT8KI85_9BACT|nr:copper homeostasis protein CutC [Fulvivirgaceae bacterium BMA10]